MSQVPPQNRKKVLIILPWKVNRDPSGYHSLFDREFAAAVKPLKKRQLQSFMEKAILREPPGMKMFQ